MDKLILTLSKQYFVKQFSRDELGIMASLCEQDLKDIAKEYDLELVKIYNQQFSVQGIFKIK